MKVLIDAVNCRLLQQGGGSLGFGGGGPDD